MERTIYINLMLLNKDERPIENISGRTTQGSITINGQSAMRRTCNITLIPDRIDFNRYLWVLNNKFKVEVGVLQPDDTIKWYPQGVYAITTFSASLTVNNYSVSIQGQDKMAFINGTIGGHIGASLDAGREESEDANGLIVYRDRPIVEIIRDIVHKFGGESYYNILINDLEQKGKILQAYAYKDDLYLGRKKDESLYKYAFWGDRKFQVDGYDEPTSLDTLAKDENIIFDYQDSLQQGVGSTVFSHNGREYQIARFTYGQTIGYKDTELTYAGELIANPGDTVTSILDKIIQMLGEFEYFYNLDGQFIFQRKKIYTQASFSPYSEELNYVDLNAQKFSYIYPDLQFVNSFNTTYGLNNVKNDFSIWGERTSISGAKLPIHLRYAIDKKPEYYKSITVTPAELEEYNKKYGFNLKGQTGRVYEAIAQGYIDDAADIYENKFYLEEDTLALVDQSSFVERDGKSILCLSPVFNLLGDENQNSVSIELQQTPVKCDWREIIYQMARDYTRYGHLENFEHKVAEANGGLYPDGKTGYEQYYLDIEAFWRDIYNPWPYEKNILISSEDAFIAEKTSLYYRGEYGQIYIPVKEEDTYDPKKVYYSRSVNFYAPPKNGEINNFPWCKSVFNAPSELDFWFDFLDTDGTMSQFSVRAIGSRTIVDSKSKPKAIHYGPIPDLLFLDTPRNTTTSKNNNSTPEVEFYLGDYSNLLVSSSQGASAKEILDDLLFKHTLATETVSMQALPVYDLSPNTLIQVNAEEANISGEYIINSINLPLTYNNMMSINAIKC